MTNARDAVQVARSFLAETNAAAPDDLRIEEVISDKKGAWSVTLSFKGTKARIYKRLDLEEREGKLEVTTMVDVPFDQSD